MMAAVLMLAIAVALLVALAFWARRRLLRRRLASLKRRLPGAAPSRALAVGSFDDIDEVIGRRHCSCGGRYRRLGEGMRAYKDRRLRAVRLECAVCEEEAEVYFDVTEMLH